MVRLLLSLPLLLIGAGLALISRTHRTAAAWAIVSQLAACIAVFVGLFEIGSAPELGRLVSEWPQPLGRLTFEADALSRYFLVWSLPFTLVGTLYAIGYLAPYEAKGRRAGPHFALLNMVSLSFVIVYTSQSVLVFLLGWEVAAIAAWLLVIWDYRNQKIRFAGFNYLVSTHVGLFVLVAAFMLLHARTGSLEFEQFGAFLARGEAGRDTIFLLLGASFALKAAFFPFHTWLPRAHSAAPAHVSALMSGVIHKAGLFGLVRFLLLMGKPEEWMGWAMLAYGVASAFFGVLFTSTQRDVKRLLGYSSTENVGIVAMGLGVGALGWSWNLPALAISGFTAALFHLLNHAIFKCLLFFGAGAIFRATHTVDLERLGGLAKKLPSLTALFLIGTLAACALPPLNGFLSEFTLYAGLFSGAAPERLANIVLVSAGAVLALVGGLSAFSMTRCFGITFLGSPRDATVHVSGETPISMRSAMIVLAALALGVSVFPELALGLVRPVVARLPFPEAGASQLEFLAPVTWASRGLLVLVLAAGLRWFVTRKARQSATWGCGYTALNPRMQYTGSSFSGLLGAIFESVMPAVRREAISTEPFPRKAGHAASHHPDPVERRLYEVLGQAEALIVQFAEKVPAQPRFVFALGLLTLLVLGGLVLAGVG